MSHTICFGNFGTYTWQFPAYHDPGIGSERYMLMLNVIGSSVVPCRVGSTQVAAPVSPDS